jgi:hypothetical protein
MSGCKDCVHDHWDGGVRVCSLRPHDFQTTQQRAIVAWLSSFYVAASGPFEAPGCPGFEDFRDKEACRG